MGQKYGVEFTEGEIETFGLMEGVVCQFLFKDN
jgi:hypothetical protein